MKKMLVKFPPVSPVVLTDYISQTCKGDQICERDLAGSYSLGKLLSVIKNEPQPEFETPDQFVTDTTMTSYPKTVQCRLDTYHAGSLNLDRPKCWFKD
jgi:hypothetical protein